MTGLLDLLAVIVRIALAVLFTLFIIASTLAFLALPFAALFRLIAG
jgi:hypothetical protein